MQLIDKQHWILACGIAAAFAVTNSHGQALREVVTSDGVFTARDSPTAPWICADAPLKPLSGLAGWFYNTSPAIGKSVALSAEHTWAAVELNNERMLGFATDGDGTPIYEVFSGDNSPAGVAAARNADRAAYLDEENFQLRVRGYTSASSAADWRYDFAPNYNLTNSRNVAVSADGTVAAAGARDTGAGQNLVVFFHADTGNVISTWTNSENQVAAVALTDDGSRALVSLSNQPRVVDTATGQTIWSGTGSGGGNVAYAISGNGNVIAVGGFSLQIYEWNGSTYSQIINLTTPPLEWFGLGVAISSDGSTVGAMSREISTETMNIRMWDVASQQMIGHVVLPGVPDSLQTAPQAAQSTPDGSVFAFATWGDGTGVYPEVLVYNRDLELIGEIDMPGSAFDVDMSPDGRWVAGTGKGVHANTFGSGGQVVVIEFEQDCAPADLNCDGVVDGADLLILLSVWGECDDCDDCLGNLNDDCTVDGADLLILLSNWG